MRIFLVCADPGVPPDGTKGASVHLRSVAGALARAGHEVTAFAARPPRSPGAFPVPVRPFSPRALTREASARPPDLIYERYALGEDRGLRAARALGVPFALEVNAPLVLEAGAHRPGSVRPEHPEVEARLFREADAVVAVSEPLRLHVARVRGTARGTWVVPNGCDPRRYPVPASAGRPGPPTIAFLGHPRPWHGAEVLPHLLALLRRRGRDARLVVIGDGPGAVAVAAEAERAGVAPWVTVTGPVSPSAAAARLVRATVGVAPYPPLPFFYFCPIKVVEYMAAGLPVVATDQGDLTALLGGGGLVVPPGDLEALAGAVQRLLDDAGLRARLGARGRRRALSRLTWDRVAARIAALTPRSAPSRAAHRPRASQAAAEGVVA